jgi:hypothetical protein
MHYDEQEEIEGRLATLVPDSLSDACCLLDFAIDRAKQGGRMVMGAEINMLRNVRKGLPMA